MIEEIDGFDLVFGWRSVLQGALSVDFIEGHNSEVTEAIFYYSRVNATSL